MIYPNGRYLTKSPGRHFGAGGAGLESANRNLADRLNRFTGLIPATSSTPGGYGAETPGLPLKPGGISGKSAITASATGSGGMGVNLSASAIFTLDLSGTGGLISSASGTAGVLLGAAASLYATKAVTGQAALTLGASGIAGATGHASGQAAMALSASWTPAALGWLSGTTSEAGLTPNGIAQAVWAKAIEAGFTAEEIMRLLASVAAGNAVGLEGANQQFKGLDGATLRVGASYNAGTRTVNTLNGG